MPKYTIVIPVKTGGVYLKQAIDSVLAQTVKDFELVIIGDTITAKADLKFLQSYNDARIKIDLLDKELNMLENWDRIKAIPKQEFFTILGYDDILFPTYLETMDALIEQHPAASLYQLGFDFVNSEGQYCKSNFTLDSKTYQTDLLNRILQNDLFIMATGYMMRSSSYEKLGGISTSYPNLLYADFELWLQMTGLSYLAFDPSVQFAFRLHESTTNKSDEGILLTAFERLSDFILSISTTKQTKELLIKQGYSFLGYHANSILFRIFRRGNSKAAITVKEVLRRFKLMVNNWGLSYKLFIQQQSIKKAIFISSTQSLVNLFYLYKKLIPDSGKEKREWMLQSSYVGVANDLPLVSICVPAYNRVDYLQRLLDSIALQDFNKLEVIITDDSTNDAVAQFIKTANYSFPLVYVKNETPKGTPVNWTEGMKYAKAPWIKIMHDDDWFASSQSLGTYMKLAVQPYSVVFAGYNAIYEKDGRVVDKSISASAFNKILKDPYQLFASNLIGPPSVVLFRKNMLELYDANLKWLVDLEGYVRMIKKYRVAYVPYSLVNMSYNDTQVTNDCFRNPDVEIKEALIYFQKHGDAVHQSWISYDGWWRLLRNLSIRSEQQLSSYADGLPIPSFLKSMLNFQKRIPLSLLKFGPVSKLCMTISFIFNS